MSDSVKFIFKTLTKIPIYVLVFYAIFNLFAFSLTYFRLLGFSYVAMQTAVENNYIPPTELATLNNYLESLKTEILDFAELKCENADGLNERKQYGSPVTVTVTGHYRFIWPLMPNEQRGDEDGKAVDGLSGAAASDMASQEVLEERRKKYTEDGKDIGDKKNNIVISYTVPGLKYYPDLLN